MAEYNWSDTPEAEQYNTLVLIDAELKKRECNAKIKLNLIGGTALLFHRIVGISTVDIDVANKLKEDVKEVCEPFISDEASYVATLAKNYEQRLVPYHADEFDCLDVYLLSIEDLIISKLGAGRFKDFEDLTKTDAREHCDFAKLMQIINTELPTKVASEVLGRLSKIE